MAMNSKTNNTAIADSTATETRQILTCKKSDLHARTHFDYQYLTRKEAHLVPCAIEEEEEEVTFSFDLSNLTPMGELQTETIQDRYRFLLNINKLAPLFRQYTFSFTEENIYYDRNMIPCIYFRDLFTLEAMKEEELEQAFFQAYQKLAGGILSKKYTCSQVQESGLEILAKDQKAAPILSCRSTGELTAWLQEQWEKTTQQIKQDKKLVNKKPYRIRQIASAVLILSLLLGILFTGYQAVVVKPLQSKVIQASKAFVTQDYVGCVDDLSSLAITRMDTYTKYILAVSYAKCEVLGKTELQNIIDKLSIYSNEIELDYWIYLGRYDVAAAQNIAQALSDDKLLIYAYMKEINLLENDITIDGGEKQSRLTELNQAITTLGKKYLEQE